MKYLLLAFALLSVASCKKKDPEPITDSRLIGSWNLKTVEGDYKGNKFYSYYTCREVFGNQNDLTEFYTDTVLNVVAESTGNISISGSTLDIELLTGYVILPEHGEMEFRGDSLVITSTNANIDYTYYLVR